MLNHIRISIYGEKISRIQIPLKIQGNKCYIEFIETGEDLLARGKGEIFNVEKLHQGKCDSDETMGFIC